jgi:hypothetical protein
MPKVLLLPGLMGNGNLRRNALTQAGFEVEVVMFDDAPVAGLDRVFNAPLQNLVPMVSMLMKSRRIFARWVFQATAAYEAFHPDIIVGSSRGGSVAMTMQVDERVPTVLLAPAYRWFRWVGGRTTITHPNVTIVHSKQDERIPFADSEELCRRCPQVRLIEAGTDHSLISPDATAIWVQEVIRLTQREHCPQPDPEMRRG